MANDLELGPRIRAARRRSGMTLQALAEKCDCTRSLLSKIENGHSMPAIATIVRIARALEIETSELFAKNQTELSAFAESLESDESFIKSEPGYIAHPFAQKFKDKAMQPFMIVARKNEVQPHSLRHPGEEFLYVLSGKMNFKVGENEYVLKRGDSLYFHATEEHQVTPISAEVRYLAIFTP